jgi:hypothetical protein
MLDGDILRNSPSFAYEHSPPLIAPVDMLLGCNSDEGMSEALGAQVVVNNTALFNDTMLAEALALWPEDVQYSPYSEV